MLIKEYEGHKPNLHPTVRVAENAVIVGKATLEADVNVWYSAVIRADGDEIFIGAAATSRTPRCSTATAVPPSTWARTWWWATGLSSTPARWGTTASSAWVRRSSPAARSAAAASSALALWWRGT